MTEDDRDRLMRIETKLDAALGSLIDHEARVRKLEKFAGWVLAGFAVAWALLELAADFVSGLIK